METEIQKDIDALEKKMCHTGEGTIERMLLEMRIDIKKDSMAVMKKIDKVNVNATLLQSEVTKIKDEQRSLDTRVQFTQDSLEGQRIRVNSVISDVGEMKDQIRVLQGIVQMQEQKHYLNKKEKEDSRLRELRNNLLISGLDEEDANTDTDTQEDEQGEDETTTAELVTDFFAQTMKITTPIPIASAIRIGKANPRTALVKLKDAKDKGAVFKNVSNLKNVKNSKDGAYYINNQLTPYLQERQRWYRHLIRYNSSLAGVGKHNLTIKKGELYVDGKMYTPPVQAPAIGEAVFPLDIEHVNRVKLVKGDIQHKGRCHFVGYAMEAQSTADVRAAYTKVKRENPNALHIACAFRIAGTNFLSLRGVEDDGEHGAGRTIYQLLEDQDTFNKAIFVVRFYGNKHIGLVRFQLITAAAKTAMARLTAQPNNRTVEANQRKQYEAPPVQPPGPQQSTHSSPMAPPQSTGQSSKVQGFVSATSPRPFTASPQYTSWGSRESVASQNNELNAEGNQSFRPRASSMDSNISYSSATSWK